MGALTASEQRLLDNGRTGKAEEIANAVAFLASHVSSYTTVTILTIDGDVSSRAKSWL